MSHLVYAPIDLISTTYGCALGPDADAFDSDGLVIGLDGSAIGFSSRVSSPNHHASTADGLAFVTDVVVFEIEFAALGTNVPVDWSVRYNFRDRCANVFHICVGSDSERADLQNASASLQNVAREE